MLIPRSIEEWHVWQGSPQTAERACDRFTLLPLNPAGNPAIVSSGSYTLMLSTRKDRSLLFSVLILLDFASRKSFVEYLQRRVAWVTTPHSRWWSPMMATMAAQTTAE